MEKSIRVTKNDNLQKVYDALMKSFSEISEILRYKTSDKKLESTNLFGDVQLDSDIAADDLLFSNLEATQVVAYALSEENPALKNLKGQDFIVTFDPIDGSSIIGSNWAVGTIVGIWKNDDKKLIGQKGTDLLGSIVSNYGPRTTFIVKNEITNKVEEYCMKKTDNTFIWKLMKNNLTINSQTKLFAPANLRAVNEHQPYKKLVDYWIENKFTLRYTGGMVPDIYQIFIKGSGIFSNPITKASPAKLRYLYEVAPLAYLVEAAGGKTTNGESIPALDLEVNGYDQRTGFIAGSSEEVERFIEFTKKY